MMMLDYHLSVLEECKGVDFDVGCMMIDEMMNGR